MPLDTRLSYRRVIVKDLNAILACQHFNMQHHESKKHTKFMIIKELRRISIISKKALKEKLKKGETF